MHGIASNTNINFYGPVFNILAVSGLISYVSDGKQTTVGFDEHRYDFKADGLVVMTLPMRQYLLAARC
ncbi:hypothetical protein [Bartonella birtlesii]|uniref:hypothetical protein n=1 Tax=Bartonella birtlesii TaxID=111504 RepID=UPI00068335E2|nr:hypothetical protein [Bartonella birtlesii]